MIKLSLALSQSSLNKMDLCSRIAGYHWRGRAGMYLLYIGELGDEFLGTALDQLNL